MLLYLHIRKDETLEEFAKRLTLPELRLWQEFYRRRCGFNDSWKQTAQQLCLLANIHRKPNTKPWPFEDFLPVRPPTRPQSAKEMQVIMQQVGVVARAKQQQQEQIKATQQAARERRKAKADKLHKACRQLKN